MFQACRLSGSTPIRLTSKDKALEYAVFRFIDDYYHSAVH